jgi:hypothetical protein
MKIKQITSVVLVLTMLVLSTSCGKSTSVNPNLPTPQSQAANLNQDLIPEESFSIYRWVKKNLLWTATAIIGASYVGLNEWRHYLEGKAIKEVDTKATSADTKADNAQDAVSQAVLNSNDAVQTANAINAKATNAQEIAKGYSDQISNALQKAQVAQSNVAFLNNKLEEHINATTNVHGIKAKVVPNHGVPGGDSKAGPGPSGSQKK